MQSAWGLDHGDGDVAKSFVPGKGFVEASKLGAKGLKRVVKPGQYKSRGLDKEQKKAVAAIADNRALFAQHAKGKMGVRGKDGVISVETSGLQQSGIAGAAWKFGGKDGKKVYIHEPAAGVDARTLAAHETAHVAPKRRTEYRMARIVTDPKKAMREEGRADAVAGVNYRQQRPTDTGYPEFARSGSNRATRRQQIRTSGRMAGQDREYVRDASGRFSNSAYRGYRQTSDRINDARGVPRPRGLKDDYRHTRVVEGTMAAAGAGVIGGGAYSLYRDSHPKKKKVSKMATKSAWGIDHEVSKAWSDKQLNSHKKAQAGLSAAAATLGVAALGAKGVGAVAPKLGGLAAKSSRMKVSGGSLKKISSRGNKAAENLSIGAAGVGGIGGFNFAGIQAAESRKNRVRKSYLFPTKQEEKVRGKGEKIGAAAGLAATAAFPGVRRSAAGSAKLGRALYQGSKVTSGGAKAIGSGQPVRGTLRNAAGNAKRAGVAGAKAGSVGLTHLATKTPGQGLAAAYLPGAGAIAGGATAHVQNKKRQGVQKSMDGGMDFGLGGVRQGTEISKAYDPEKKRMRRLDTYNAASNVAAGALGAAAVGTGRQAVKGAKRALQGDAITKPTLKLIGTKAGKAGALGLGAVGAAVGADRIKQYRRTNGRTYRSLNS